MTKQFLLASDFDQTLSFHDSGVVLSELIGFHGFHDKVKGLAEMNLVQQGAELSYLILHDPDFRNVRREHLLETGKRIRLKHDVALFARALDNLAEGYKFHFNVISAAPQEIIESALEGIAPPDHIFGTRFRYKEATGEVDSIIRASAGWGKITVLEELRTTLGISHDQIIYMGDGSSDLPVMMHINQYDGLTIAVSEAKFITRVAKRTVLSDNAMSVLVPVLEKVMRWDSAKIRRFFASYGLTLLEWEKVRTFPKSVPQAIIFRSACRKKAILRVMANVKTKKGVIGILTGGGDVPGLNPAIRGVTLRALREGFDVIGIRHGWAGLVDMVRDKDFDNSDNFLLLDEEIVDRTGRTGGTFLHSSRTNPGRVSKSNVPAHLKDKFTAEKNDLTAEVLKNLAWLGIDMLIRIGGDDTLSYGVRLHTEG